MNGILAIGKLYECRLSPVIVSLQQLESHLFWISDKVDTINVNANGLSACDQLIAVSSVAQTLRLHIGRSECVGVFLHWVASRRQVQTTAIRYLEILSFWNHFHHPFIHELIFIFLMNQIPAVHYQQDMDLRWVLCKTQSTT
jgi:hypothetical protein